MNHWQPTLMEILQPRRFQSNPKRAEATRTVLQPDIDKFEQCEVAAGTRASAQMASCRATTGNC